MQAAAPTGVGAMAAVLGAEDALVQEVCEQAAGSQVVVPANFIPRPNSDWWRRRRSRSRAGAAGRGVRKAVKLAVQRALAHPADARGRQPAGRGDGRAGLARAGVACGAERRCEGA